MKITDLLVSAGLVSDRSSARRALAQGAVKVNDVKTMDIRLDVPVGDVVSLRVGKKSVSGFVVPKDPLTVAFDILLENK